MTNGAFVISRLHELLRGEESSRKTGEGQRARKRPEKVKILSLDSPRSTEYGEDTRFWAWGLARPDLQKSE
jgi:predicted nucleic acid-binding protein